MNGYIVIRVSDGQYVYGTRFNGEYSYYSCNHYAEVFFSRREAEDVARIEWGDSKSHIIHIEIPEVPRKSIGLMVVKWASKIAAKTGYYPTKKEAREKILTLLDHEEYKAVKKLRNEQADLGEGTPNSHCRRNRSVDKKSEKGKK